MPTPTTFTKSNDSVSDVPIRVGDIATPGGYFGLLLQDALSSIATKYFEFYSGKCETSLEEARAVLGLPITPLAASAPIKPTPGVELKDGEPTGIPGTTVAKPAPRKRASTKVLSPHIDRVAGPDTPPIEGWCDTVHTKGKLKDKYCTRAVSKDTSKGNTKKCTICWKAILAAEAKKKTIGGIAPGANDLAPGSFSTALPVSNPRPKFMVESYKNYTDFVIQKDTGIIYKNVNGTHIACKVDTPNGAAPLGEKEIAIIEQLKVPRLCEDGSVVWPDGRVTAPAEDAKVEKPAQPPPSLLNIPGFGGKPSIAGVTTGSKTNTIIPPPNAIQSVDDEEDDDEEYYDDDDE